MFPGHLISVLFAFCLSVSCITYDCHLSSPCSPRQGKHGLWSLELICALCLGKESLLGSSWARTRQKPLQSRDSVLLLHQRRLQPICPSLAESPPRALCKPKEQDVNEDGDNSTNSRVQTPRQTPQNNTEKTFFSF